MNHLTEEQLALHYYGEPEEDAAGCERHLQECSACREAYGAMQRVLNVVDGLPVPERAADYEGALWQRVAARLPAGRSRLAGGSAYPTTAGRSRLAGGSACPTMWWRWAAAGTVLAGLMTVAFFAGRFSQPRRASPAATAAADPHAGERILLVAVGDYLERSQMVLIELANANPQRPLDISEEQERAADLVGESRLYRQTAEHAGDAGVAAMLDDLDRVLLEIAHGPSRLSPRELQDLRQRLEAEGTLFKIRVLDSNVRNREGSL